MLNHNKKRNVGLVSEFFAKYIAHALVSQKPDNIEKAKKLYVKYFSGDTEICKEAKLFNILYNTRVSSKEVAFNLIGKVKTLCEQEHANIKKLEDEKTRLLHEINNTLGDKDFFNRSVNDYKLQGAIQVLLSSWRSKVLTENIGELASLEDSLLEHVTSGKSAPSHQADTSSYLEMTNNEIDSLVVGLMTEKFNSRFGLELSEEQRKIISCYAFSENPEQRSTLVELLENLRTRTIGLVEKTLEGKKIDKELIPESLGKKLVGIKNLLKNEYGDVSKVNDDALAFYMTLTKLEKELGT